MEEKRVSKTYRLPEELCNLIEVAAQKENVSKNTIVERAILDYLHKNNNYDEYLVKRIVEEFDKKYYSNLTGIRMSARSADLNSQIMIETLNSILLLKGYKASAFTARSQKESPLLATARTYIKDVIAKAKQKADYKKGKGVSTK